MDGFDSDMICGSAVNAQNNVSISSFISYFSKTIYQRPKNIQSTALCLLIFRRVFYSSLKCTKHVAKSTFKKGFLQQVPL